MRWVPSSFRNRLALLFVGVTLLVGVPFYLYLSHSYAGKILEDRGSAAHDLASSISVVLQQNMRERQRDIDLMSRGPLYRNAPFESPEFQASLERLQADSHYSWIGLADTQGVVRAATGAMLVGQDVSQRPWFIEGQTGRFVGDLHEALLLSKLLPSAGGGPLRFIDFAAPIYNRDGELRGVLAAHVNWSWARELVAIMEPSEAEAKGLEVFIVNKQHEVIYPEGQTLPEAFSAFLQTTKTHATVYDQNHSQDYLTAKHDIGEVLLQWPLQWQVLVRQPLPLALEDVQRLQQLLVGLVLLAALLFLILAWRSASYISRPIEQLARMARRVEKDDSASQLVINKGALEIRQLSEAIGKMANTLISRREALQQSNAELEQKVSQRTRELARANAELLQLSRQDALTGLANRRVVDERLQSEFLRSQRHHQPFVLVMVDIDYFKRINDSYGHAVGDQVLQQVAQLLRDSVRESDLVGRFGGEEFILLLPSTGREDGAKLAEKIRQRLEAMSVEVVGHITASFGVAQYSSDVDDVHELLRQADSMLYAAKAGGRNRVVIAP